MRLAGGGRLERGDFFEGQLTDADVEVEIDQGSLLASYEGRLMNVNPAVALNDPRFAASLSGSGRASFSVRDLLLRSPGLPDYEIDATLILLDSRSRGVRINRGQVAARLAGSSLAVASLELTGPAVEVRGSGEVALDGERSSRFDYEVVRADLSELHTLIGRNIPGDLATTGRLTGPTGELRLAGEATVNRLEASGVSALTTTGSYDITIPVGSEHQPARRRVEVKGRASFVEAFNQSLQQVDGSAIYEGDRVSIDLAVLQSEGVSGTVRGDLALRFDQRTADFMALEIGIQKETWRMVQSAPSQVSWDDAALSVGAMTFVGTANPGQRATISGTVREDGNGTLELAATRVSLESFSARQPARYGGFLDAMATIRGTLRQPLIEAEVTVTGGRIRQFAYEKLSGRVDYSDAALRIDLRLDQAPGASITAAGIVPMDLLGAGRSEQPVDFHIASSSIGLGLVEGLTDTVRDVTGSVRVNVTVVGTSRDPHFAGVVELAGAGFVVAASGARYQNGNASLRLSTDLIRVESFHLEDNRGRPLDVSGSLGTHELRVGELAIDVRTKGFELMRNQYGNIEVDAQLGVRGRAESPRLQGTVTVVGGEASVDEILDRTLFRPYSTEAKTDPTDADGEAPPLNPWDRLGLDVMLRIPGTLRMRGDEVQVTAGTPIGLGDINLRVFGDLYFYKDPGDVAYITGSLDSLTGSYTFQGRRFDVDPQSSVNFHGDLDPQLFVTVTRLISGVDTQVTIAGPLREPELRLTSNPPLEPSDILSLIVFGSPANLLSDLQQRELAIRAGVIAAGFLASPLVGALEETLGLEILEIEAPDDPVRSGPRITIGDELLPGLIARFSRQFGQDEYDEATIEYYLSRILRIRATFSDAATLNARSPFRRTERAGIDLLLFFSF
jgi:translocation and assembly module TamB